MYRHLLNPTRWSAEQTLFLIGLGIFETILDKIYKNETCPHLKFLPNGLAAYAIYEKRPVICREYPKEPEDLLPGCGF